MYFIVFLPFHMVRFPLNNNAPCPKKRYIARCAAPRCRKRSAAESRPGYPFAGVSTGQFASAYILTNYERECADPLVFERGLARERAEPSDFEGKSAHTLMKLVDLEKDTKGRVLTPWIDNLAFPLQASTERAHGHSPCGCLAKSVIVDFFQGLLERSRGHFFCIDRRKTDNCHNYYYETYTSISSVFNESVRICTAYCCRQS